MMQDVRALLDSSSPVVRKQHQKVSSANKRASAPWHRRHKHLGTDLSAKDLEQVSPVMQSKKCWPSNIKAVQPCTPASAPPLHERDASGLTMAQHDGEPRNEDRIIQRRMPQERVQLIHPGRALLPARLLRLLLDLLRRRRLGPQPSRPSEHSSGLPRDAICRWISSI